MNSSDGLYMLPLPVEHGGQTMFLNTSLILDSVNGATLVDAGLPGQQDAIAAALAEYGLALSDLKQIIITHHDIDHIGSLHDLVRASGARVLAHATETPFIDGTVPPRFAAPEVLAQRPELRAVAEQFRPTRIDEQLHDGGWLELGGGLLVIFTPGHTSGHICLYHQPSKTLVSGDALTASDGQLQGPNESATPDMHSAAKSVAKLADLDVQAIICYHGGLVNQDAGQQLRRVAQELAQQISPGGK